MYIKIFVSIVHVNIVFVLFQHEKYVKLYIIQLITVYYSIKNIIYGLPKIF